MSVGKQKMQNGRMVRRYSWRGYPYSVWENPTVMPKIEDKYLENPIYFYASRDDAEKGEKQGGCGFIVGVLTPGATEHFYPTVYAVTNHHVAITEAFTFIRINTNDGNFDILETKADSWIAHGEDDLAVCPIKPSLEKHNFRLVGMQDFLTEELQKRHNIGPGDEIFMVGRYTEHAGMKQNLPIARFGNISMSPNEPLENLLHKKTSLFLCEVRSVSGFSGSPVFVYDTPYNRSGARSEPFYHFLLGIDCGHLPVYEEPLSAGISAIIPAWRIMEIINRPELVELRAAEMKELVEDRRRARRSGIIVPDSTGKELLKQDSEDALKKVGRRTAPSPPAEAGMTNSCEPRRGDTN